MALDHVGKRIANERERRLLTQAELAQRAGISQSTLSQIESGRVSPHIGTLRKIARALEIEPQELTYPKAQAPSSRLGEEADEERREARTLIASWGILLKDLRSRLRELLDSIPVLPDDEADLRVRAAEIRELITQFYSISHAVVTSGASHVVLPFVEAKESRQYLPNDLYGAITDYQGAMKDLNLDLIPRAEKWVHQAEEILEGLKAAETDPTHHQSGAAKKE
jgi:transcriptional regulator with XRE-family HTH domain